MSDRVIAVLGTIASVLGLVVTIITVIFTEYKVISLISLFVLEIILAFIWLHYVKQKNKVVFPYDHENEYLMLRYVLETENKMEYEIIRVQKITKPNIPKLPLRVFWSGRGNITIESAFSNQKIDYNFDAKTGEISFYYPTPSVYKFGDIVVVHVRMLLEDTTNQNSPELSWHVRVPTKLCVMEVILKYKDGNSPASFNYRPVEGGGHSLITYQKERDVVFDTKSRSYRVVITNPITHYVYQLKWNK